MSDEEINSSLNKETTIISMSGNLAGRINSIAVNVILVALISGCTSLGPDYSTPDTKAYVESAWIEAKDPMVSGASSTDPKWWATAFKDAEINQLVETALQQNLSLRSAGLRVLQSQQQLAIAIGNQYPQQQQMTGLAGREKSGGVIFNEYSLGLNLSWETIAMPHPIHVGSESIDSIMSVISTIYSEQFKYQVIAAN